MLVQVPAGSAREGLLLANVSRSYAIRIGVGSMAVVVSTINLLWAQAGMSMFEVMGLQSLFALCVAFSQVPTGYLADRLGRKVSMVAGTTAMVVGDVVYALGNSFGTFLVAEVILALGMAFVSGADEALMYESLAELGRKDEYTTQWGKAGFWSFICSAVAACVGGLAGSVNVRLPMWLSVVACLVLLGLTCSLVEPERAKPVGESWRGVLRDIRQVFVLCFSDKRLRSLTVFTALISALNNSAVWLYQPYMQLSGVPIVLWGVVFTAFNIVASIASRKADKVQSRFNESATGLLPLLLVAMSYLLLGTWVTVASVGFALLHQVVRGYLPVLVSAEVNALVREELRASVASVRGMAERALYALAILPLGLRADSSNVASALQTAGWLTLGVGSVCLYVLRKGRSDSQV